jgi:CheY-specific phosphatase CheX
MSVKFFGQFLVEKGIVSRDTLLKAIELQESVNLKFGEMAHTMKLVSDADIERIHDAQRSEDLMFGDMAVKLGILTDEQIKQVLAMQSNSHLYIGEALVRVGAFTAEALHQHLETFKIDQAPYVTTKVIIPQGVSNPDIWEMTADLSSKLIARIVNLRCRLGLCRVVDRLETNDVVAEMAMSGDIDAMFLLSVTSRMQKRIAEAILKEDSVDGEPREVLDDAVMELVNILCGNVAAKAAQQGRSLEIAPPLVIHPDQRGIPVPPGKQGLVFPIVSADGEKMELALFIKR